MRAQHQKAVYREQPGITRKRIPLLETPEETVVAHMSMVLPGTAVAANTGYHGHPRAAAATT